MTKRKTIFTDIEERNRNAVAVQPRQRVNIIATFEIPGRAEAYSLLRLKAGLVLHLLQDELGTDAVLEYAALEIRSLDTIVWD